MVVCGLKVTVLCVLGVGGATSGEDSVVIDAIAMSRLILKRSIRSCSQFH